MKYRLAMTLIFVVLILVLTFSGRVEKLFLILKMEQLFFRTYCHEHLLFSSLVFLLLFVSSATLCLPFMSLFMFCAGAIFSFKYALVLSSVGLSLGACGAFLISRYYLGAYIENKFGHRFEKIYENFALHGDYYLMSLRLSPLIPYWMINVFMGLTRMKLWKFYLLTQAGTLIFVFIIVNAGTQVATLEHLSDLLSIKVWFSLLLLGFVPLIFRYLMIKKSRS